MAWSHDHACIIGQGVADLARVFAVTSGADERDPTSLPLPPASIPAAPSRPPRIGVVQNFFPDLTQPAMQAAVEESAKRLADAGAEVVNMTLPDEFGLAWPAWAIVGGSEGYTLSARADAEAGRGVAEPPRPPAHLVQTASKFGMLGKAAAPFIPASYYLHAQRLRRWLRERIDAELSGYDAVLMATAPGPAPHGLESSGDWSLLMPWTHLGNPAVSIPCGLSPEGMPLGLQLVAPNQADESLLAAAGWCEDVLGRLPAPQLTEGM
ncbi:MAG: amidase [Dehalococcoidia bacterium]|nr:amidase [Dehalococcoidia bacterium]